MQSDSIQSDSIRRDRHIATKVCAMATSSIDIDVASDEFNEELQRIARYYDALEAKIDAVRDAKRVMATMRAKKTNDWHVVEDGEDDAIDVERANALASVRVEREEELQRARERMREASSARARAEAYVERERASALEEAQKAREISGAIGVFREFATKVNAEEAEKYDDADDYRSRSPEGTSPRASAEAEGKEVWDGKPTTTTTNAIAVESRKSTAQSSDSHVKKSTLRGRDDARATAIDFAIARNGETKRVDMAALAPKRAEAARTTMNALAPVPVREMSTSSMEDPHRSLMQRLRSTKIADEAAGASSGGDVAAANSPEKREDVPVRPPPLAASKTFPSASIEPTALSRSNSARPRGLAAAVKDIIQTAGSTSRRGEQIESSFGMPANRDPMRVVPPPLIAVNADTSVFEPVVHRKFVPSPAAPIRVEPNPYLMTEEDLKPAPVRSRSINFGENVPLANGLITTSVSSKPATLEESSGRSMELMDSAGPSAPKTPPTTTTTSMQLVTIRSEQMSPGDRDSGALDAIKNDALPPVILKPKIPRALVEPQRFKVAEMRNLFSFSRHGRYSQMKELLSKGVPIDARDENGNSALIIACQNGQGRLVKLLVRSGADPNLQNKRGNTPLHYAILFKFDVIADFVIKHGARTDIRNCEGLTCYEFVG